MGLGGFSLDKEARVGFLAAIVDLIGVGIASAESGVTAAFAGGAEGIGVLSTVSSFSPTLEI